MKAALPFSYKRIDGRKWEAINIIPVLWYMRPDAIAGDNNFNFGGSEEIEITVIESFRKIDTCCSLET